ncbi:MAG TPA: NAD(P)H-dependent oxidoreductase [Flavisolibacter sp.]|nr:NAD(P)H-dependent oxidoreductase [Flavisolibacter sp.]
MAKVLILFAHPALEKSRVHARLIRHLKDIDGIRFHDLYEAYPDFDIDVQREQRLLIEHDIIIWQHPFYWYSGPAMIKQWQDLVLEHNWAYGSEGTMLAGKQIFNVISCGGSRQAYSEEGRNRFSIPQLLAPFDQTARLCKMIYLPPFVVHGTHKLKKEDIELHAVQYEQLLIALVSNRITPDECIHLSYLNDLNPIPDIIKT